jgi:hypothetical protein
MQVTRLEAIFRALNEAQAEYLVVGGVAVIAHGHSRLTNDLGLVLDLSSKRLAGALQALKGVGMRPRIPVDILEFTKPASRQNWQAEKGMVVFSLFHLDEPDLVVDIFIKEPFDFKAEYAQAAVREFAPGLFVTVVSLDRLIEMKREVARPQDLIDADKLTILKAIQDENP